VSEETRYVTRAGLDADCCGTGPRMLRMRSAKWELDVENVLRSGVAEVGRYDVKVRILG
jgi:hypothetical protein